MISNAARLTANSSPSLHAKPPFPEPIKLDPRFVKFVEYLATVPIEIDFANRMEQTIQDASQLYAAARYLNCPVREANLLKHSENLRDYLGINSPVDKSSGPPRASGRPSIASEYVTEALAWAAARSEMPYQEFAISKVAESVSRHWNRVQVIDALKLLGTSFNALDQKTRHLITHDILTETVVQAMPRILLYPFREAIASKSPTTVDRSSAQFRLLFERFNTLKLSTTMRCARKT